jgi:hypothetical protein
VRLLIRIESDDVIADILNRNKLVTGYGNRWFRERVTALRSHHKIPVQTIQPHILLFKLLSKLHLQGHEAAILARPLAVLRDQVTDR